MRERKLALVTGGSRGIGKAICIKLAACGMDIVTNYHTSYDSVKETVSACEAYGVKVAVIQADLSKKEDCEALIEKALALGEGHIDVLVNNAGITRDQLILRMTDQQFDEVIDTNLRGVFYMLRGVAKIMLKNRSGKIVNISSVSGVMGNAGQVNYAAAKAGVIGMTKSLARELAGRKITVNAVAPGMIRTDMTENIPENEKKQLLEKIPFKAMGRPEDIADAVAFLAGDQSSYITGQVLCVDGGMAI